MKFHQGLLRVTLLVFVIFNLGCGTYHMNSTWLDREITIDGNADDRKRV